jgi:molybdate transport system substrate-binding protein
MKSVRWIVIFLLVIAMRSYPADGAGRTPLRFAVAASCAQPMTVAARAFEKKNPGVKIEIIPGASGKLAAQIEEGAPFDLFASADIEYPAQLASKGLAADKPEVFAYGRLILFSVNGTDLSKGISVCADDSVKRIALANPNVAPFGRAAVNALKKAGIYDAAAEKFVYAENVSQAARMTIDAADIGFIARSLMSDPAMKKYRRGDHWVDLPEDIAPPVPHGIVIIKSSRNADIAENFRAFILSTDGKNILSEWGY